MPQRWPEVYFCCGAWRPMRWVGAWEMRERDEQDGWQRILRRVATGLLAGNAGVGVSAGVPSRLEARGPRRCFFAAGLRVVARHGSE